MARPAAGPEVDWHKGVWRVRFSHEGRRVERSTGVTDERHRAAAVREGRRIFAEVLGGREPEPVATEPATTAPPASTLGRLVARWIDELSDVNPETRGLYELIASRWLVEFGTLDAMTDQEIARHTRRRLARVKGKTVRNELSILRKFLCWAVEDGALAKAPVVPSVKASVAGTRHPQPRRVRAPELPPEDVERFLAKLPELSGRDGWPVRDRATVAYETMLRPATLDKLRAPENYAHGRSTIVLIDEDDKELYGREVPITARAREALDRVCKPGHEGPILGAHRYDPYIREAALAVGLPATTCLQHLRSAGITRALEASGNLPGTAQLVGHRHVSTTDKYSRRSARAARAVVETLDRVLGGDSAATPPEPPETPAK